MNVALRLLAFAAVMAALLSAFVAEMCAPRPAEEVVEPVPHSTYGP